jgi:hypothetical protein
MLLLSDSFVGNQLRVFEPRLFVGEMGCLMQANSPLLFLNRDKKSKKEKKKEK